MEKEEVQQEVLGVRERPDAVRGRNSCKLELYSFIIFNNLFNNYSR